MILGRRCSPDTRLTCPHGTRHLTADKDPLVAEGGAVVAVAFAGGSAAAGGVPPLVLVQECF